MRVPAGTAIVPVVPWSPTASALPSTWPSIFRLNSPGSSAGTRCLTRVIEPWQRGEPSSAVALLPVSFHVRLPENSAATASSWRPGSNVVGWPRFGGAGSNTFWSCGGVTPAEFGIVVAEVGQEAAALGLDALDVRRDRVGRGRLWRRGRGAAVLPDRLSFLTPVGSREGLRLAVLVHVLVRRDDVPPALLRIDGPGVVQVPALEVAVVRDRRLVRHVRVAVGARRVADADLRRLVDASSCSRSAPWRQRASPRATPPRGRGRTRRGARDLAAVGPCSLPLERYQSCRQTATIPRPRPAAVRTS